MSVLSYPFYSLLLKLPNKRMKFPFPPLKLSNKEREEYSKIILFIHFHPILFTSSKRSLKIILEYSSLPLFGSFNRGNGKLISLFGSLSRREQNGQEGTLIPPYSLKISNFHSPLKLGGLRGNEIRFMNFLLKLPKYPIYSTLYFKIGV